MTKLSSHHALRTLGFRARVANQVSLAVEARDKHRAAVLLALGLIAGNNWRLASGRSDVSDTLAETAPAEFFGATEKLNRVVGVEGRKQEFHGSEVLVAEWKEIGSHRVPSPPILRPAWFPNRCTCVDQTASGDWRWPRLISAAC